MATVTDLVDVQTLIEALERPEARNARGIRAAVSGRELDVLFPHGYLVTHFFHALRAQ